MVITILPVEKYSVLISVYKNDKASFLALAIDSMRNQTCPPDEIVLVKDGPLTTELDTLVSNYQNRYPELFTVIENKKNMGLGLALNRGLCACRNELVARMDADDIAAKDRCEKQLAYFQTHPDTAVLGGQIEEFIGTPGNVVDRRLVPCENQEIYAYLKKRCPFNHMTVMLKKSEVLSAGNYLDCFWDEDYYLWIRMAIQACSFANLPDALVHVRTSEDTFARRGGRHYLKSELFLQRLMLKNRLITPLRYLLNVMIRVTVQRLMPNRVRRWVYLKFARQ